MTKEKPIVWTIDIQASPPHLGCSLHFEVPVFNVWRIHHGYLHHAHRVE